MDEPRWFFAEPGPVQRQRNSKLDEHFSGSGSDRAGDLVREGVQNAGDARRNGAAVRVRIAFGEVSAASASTYGAGIFEHIPYISKQKGMSAVESVTPGSPCRFLSFEDFNTTGLTGDPLTDRRYDGDPPNAFHTFFRAEGQTDKTDDHKQGSKGVGKITFLAASRARAVLGMTYREDNRTLLFGTAVLHTHRKDGKDFDGDAWFGCKSGNTVQPIEDRDLISKFSEDFGLVRQPDQPGFSLVIPWLDTNEDDGITFDRVVDAVLRDHPWPILRNDLVVEVVAMDGSKTIIDSAHYLAVLNARKNEALKAAMIPVAELISWALGHRPDPSDRLALHGEGAPKWSGTILMLPEQRDKFRELLDAGGQISVRVPLRIRPKAKSSAEAESYFDVFMVREPALTSTPSVHFFRAGLSISGMAKRLPGVRALVVAEEIGIARLLRAAENPSHTKWNAKPIKEQYIYAPATLTFIVESAKHLVALLAGDPAQKDSTIWANEFSIPTGGEVAGSAAGHGKKSKSKPKPGLLLPPPPPPPKKRPYEITASGGRVMIKPSGKPFANMPAELEVKLAYHVRGRDPLAHWVRDDFDLTRKSDFKIEMLGCELSTRDPNRLVVRISSPEFVFGIDGFDIRREVYCKPRLVNGPEAGEEVASNEEGGVS